MRKNTIHKTKSRVDQITEQLIEIIRHDNLAKGEQLPPTAELAKQFNVSYVTVSRALLQLQKNGWIKRINGVGTFISRGPEIPSIKVIGIPLRVEGNPFFIACYEKLSYACNKRGIKVILGNGVNEMEFIERLAEETDEHAMIRFPAGPNHEAALQAKLKKHSIRTVTLNDWWSEGGPFPCIRTDEESTVEKLLDFLFRKGHRNIALLDDHFNCPRIRAHQAFIQWHWKKNIQLHSAQFLYFGADDYRTRLAELPQNGISAVLSLFDLLSLNTLEMLEYMHIKVPEQLSIVSFDGTREAAMKNLTASQQDLDAMVEKTLELLFSTDYHSTNVIKITSKFISGETVADLSSKI